MTRVLVGFSLTRLALNQASESVKHVAKRSTAEVASSTVVLTLDLNVVVILVHLYVDRVKRQRWLDQPCLRRTRMDHARTLVELRTTPAVSQTVDR